MSQINPSQGYGNQYPGDSVGVNNVGASKGGEANAAGLSEGNGILPEDAVHLKMHPEYLTKDFPRLSINSYKQSLGQDISFVKETLRNKIAEYGLPPQTKLSVSKDVFGKITMSGHVKADVLERIQTDLNNNQSFKQSFDRVSVQEPTLNYLDTASKLSKAYGVGNAIVSAIVSDNNEFNSLQDLAHRYAKYGETVVGEDQLGKNERFELFA